MTGRDEIRLRGMLNDSVPPLPEPRDRVAAVRERVRRRRALLTTACAAAAAAAVGVVGFVPVWLGGETAQQSPAAAPAPRATGAPQAATAGCGARPSTPVPDVSGTPHPANQAALDDIAQRVRSHAQARYADVFADLEIQERESRVRVYRKPSPDFDKWVLDEFAADCVELLDAQYSASELQAFVDRVEADRSYWSSRGVEFNTVSVRVDGTVFIGVDGSVLKRASRALPSRYPFPVVVTEEGPVDLLGGDPGSSD
jgi:hypothetical protein